MKMQIAKSAILFFFISSLSLAAHSQVLRESDPIPQGAVIYSLPMTSITISITVAHKDFTAGIYSAYAKKYLGIDAQRNDSETYTIKGAEISSYVEADPSINVAVNLGNSKNAGLNFLKFSSQGLIVAPGTFTSASANYRFPSEFSIGDNIEAVSNLEAKTTNLYKSVTNDSGEVEKVAVPQTQIVQKTQEQKAEETAQLLYKIKQKKVDILTGETDANYSGAALGDAVKEMRKLEAEYTTLFLGKSRTERVKASTEILPDAKNAKQIYVAFRISDTQGILPAENLSGRPVYLELSAANGKIASSSLDEEAALSKGKAAYRTPVVVVAKLIDGQKVLAQKRIPVYQFGKILYFPLEIALGK